MQTSAETQERVRQAADELGYTGNAVARALASGRTGLVGVLSGSLEDLGEQRFVEALGRGLGRHDLHMLVADARGEPERERALARQLARPVGRRPGRLRARSLRGPVAGARRGAARRRGRRRAGRPTVGQVLFDNRARRDDGARALPRARPPAARRAHARAGRPRRTGPPSVVVAEVCAALGLEATIVNSPHSVDGATEVAAALLAARPRPDRRLLPVRLHRVRRLRRGGRARARDPARHLRGGLRRSPDRARRPAAADQRRLGIRGRRDRRRRSSPRRSPAARARAARPARGADDVARAPSRRRARPAAVARPPRRPGPPPGPTRLRAARRHARRGEDARPARRVGRSPLAVRPSDAAPPAAPPACAAASSASSSGASEPARRRAPSR